MTFVYDNGDPIQTGTAGDHDYVYADGAQVTDLGLSDTTFEDGTGLGGGNIIVEGQTIEPWETAQSASAFYNYEGDGGDELDATGLKDLGVLSAFPSDDVLYFFVHKDTRDGSWHIGFNGSGGPTFTGSNQDGQRSVNIEWRDLNALGVDGGSPLVADDAVGSENGGGYYNDGDAVETDNYWNNEQGDGAMYPLPSGSYTLELVLIGNSQTGNTEAQNVPMPDETIFRSEDGTSIRKGASPGTTWEVTVNI